MNRPQGTGCLTIGCGSLLFIAICGGIVFYLWSGDYINLHWHLSWPFVGFLGGSGFLALGIEQRRRDKHFQRFGRSTRGTVVRLAEVQMGGNPTYAPVISYRDEQGQEQEFTSRNSFHPPRHHVGQEVEVQFVPGPDRRPRIPGSESSLALTFVGSGLIFAMLGVLALAVLLLLGVADLGPLSPGG